MDFTKNLNLQKPAGSDNFRREVINGNMDKIDDMFDVSVGHSHDGTAGKGKKIRFGDLADVPAGMNPSAHKATHAAGGADALTPADIGAASQAALSAHLEDYVRQPGYSGTGGTSTAYTVTFTPALTAYTNGVGVTIVPHIDCGASPTININGKGAINLLKQDGTVYGAGELKSGNPYSFKYVGGSFFADSSGGLDEFFGDGSDGALNTSGNVTIPVTAHSGIAIKQYSSITINAGHTVTTDNPCRGLIMYSQGDVNISGTVDMSRKAGLAPNGEIVPMVITKKAKKTAKTLSLLHFNSDIVDQNSRTWTNNGSATFDTTNKKFGTAAISFNGTSQWIDTPASDDFSFGNDDFTIEFWWRPTSSGKEMPLCGNTGNNPSTFCIVQNSENRIEGYVYGSSQGSVVSSTFLSINTWYHIVFVRYGNLLKLFVNGTQEGGDQPFSIEARKCLNKVAIGRNGELDFGNYACGQIDEFRIVKGKALYTTNFTPPGTEYIYTAAYNNLYDIDIKYYKLSTLLQGLRGGYGGNGGYGGGSSGLYRSAGGTGGSGRQNLGGFGGGGGGGWVPGGPDNARGGNGGSIPFAELGGGTMSAGITCYTGSINSYYFASGGDGSNGCGGSGGAYNIASGSTLYLSISGKGGAGNGGGGGGSGGAAGNTAAATSGPGSDGQYAGGFILIIAKGNITINASGLVKANGGNGGSGGNASGNYIGAGGGGGGGAGGGVVALMYKGAYQNSGTIQVNGGTGGGAGNQVNGAENGASGTSGSVGTIHTQQL